VVARHVAARVVLRGHRRVVIFTGRGFRLALCLYAMYALHWLFLHATTLLPPDDIVWRFPEGGSPSENLRERPVVQSGTGQRLR